MFIVNTLHRVYLIYNSVTEVNLILISQGHDTNKSRHTNERTARHENVGDTSDPQDCLLVDDRCYSP